jgi:uncharacterized protein YqeY
MNKAIEITEIARTQKDAGEYEMMKIADRPSRKRTNSIIGTMDLSADERIEEVNDPPA